MEFVGIPFRTEWRRLIYTEIRSINRDEGVGASCRSLEPVFPFYLNILTRSKCIKPSKIKQRKEFFQSLTTGILARSSMKTWHHLRYVFSDTPTRVAFTCSVQYCFKCNKAHSRCSGREFPGLTSLKLFHTIAHTWGGEFQRKTEIYGNQLLSSRLSHAA